MNKYFFFFIIIIISFSACKPSVHYKKIIKFENSDWMKFNNLEYQIPVEAGKVYSFEGIFTLDSLYTQRKLELGFYLELPGGEERLEDHSIRILDFEYQPLGIKTKEGYQIKKTFKKQLRINETGMLMLQIVHHSQYLNNMGIISFELSVSEK